jgi:multidrug efflux pump
MTSFAFILGVMPLVLSTGAGSASRKAIGTGVAGGMLAATGLGIFLIPVFYVVVRRIFKLKVNLAPAPDPDPGPGIGGPAGRDQIV